MKRRNIICPLLLLPLLALALCCLPQAQQTLAGAPEKYIALTFDDGPRSDTTQRLLDGLEQRGASATFFLIGAQIEGREDIVRRMAEQGHQVGNHTFNHTNMEHLSPQCLQEIEKTDALLTQLLGEGEYWLRPPWGLVDKSAKQCVEMPMIHWSIDTEDWKSRDAEEICRRITENAREGDIILLHDIYDTSVDAALCVIDTLQSEGFVFVTVRELFERMGIVPCAGELYSRPDKLRQ